MKTTRRQGIGALTAGLPGVRRIIEGGGAEPVEARHRQPVEPEVGEGVLGALTVGGAHVDDSDRLVGASQIVASLADMFSPAPATSTMIMLEVRQKRIGTRRCAKAIEVLAICSSIWLRSEPTACPMPFTTTCGV